MLLKEEDHEACKGEAFVEDFRRIVELKYSLMPYIYAQAMDASERGLSMIRALFFEFPDDPTSWLIEDQCMFGEDLLVAPLFSEGLTRMTYLPTGQWLDYQSGRVYPGERWHRLEGGEVPIILLVREQSVVPHVEVAQSTSQIDWDRIELRVFGSEQSVASGLFALPGDKLHELKVDTGVFPLALENDPFKGSLNWELKHLPDPKEQ